MLNGPEHIEVDALGPVRGAPEVVDAQGEPIAARWVSSDPGVASLDDNGVVVAHAPGAAVLTADLPHHPLSWRLTVRPELTLRFISPPTDLVMGQTTPLRVASFASGRALPAVGVRWQSADPRIATVNADGGIQAVAPGTTWVTATTTDAAATVELDILPAR